MTRAVMTVLTVAAATGHCFLRAYSVEPVRAAWSGWTTFQNNYISQTITNNCDSLVYCELFTGEGGASPYFVDVLTYPGGAAVASGYSDDARDHAWVRFDLNATCPESIIRGRQLEFRFTRAGQARINFYFQRYNPYGYGLMIDPNQQPPPRVDEDLCMRLYGKAYVDWVFGAQSLVGVCELRPWNPDSFFVFRDSANWLRCIEREREAGVRFDKLGYGFWGFVQPARDSWDWSWADNLMGKFASVGVRPTMALRGSPGWATCAKAWAVYFPGRVREWRPHGGAMPKNLYFPVVADSEGSSVINPDNYYAKYIYEFVRRYGPIGTSFNEQEAGTFWRENGAIPYQPVVLYEGWPEVPWDAFNYLNPDNSADSGGYWRLDSSYHHHGAPPTVAPDRESDGPHLPRHALASYRKTQRRHDCGQTVQPSGDVCAPRDCR